jgi:Ca2+-binding EF-hand superfamily protein
MGNKQGTHAGGGALAAAAAGSTRNLHKPDQASTTGDKFEQWELEVLHYFALHAFPCGLPFSCARHAFVTNHRHTRTRSHLSSQVLKTTFKDLTRRSAKDKKNFNFKFCDKAAFLRFFSNVPGIVGERMFHVFDGKKDNVIDFEEFITGLTKFSRGTTEDKVGLLFQIFDMEEQNRVTRSDMKTILTHLSDAIHANATSADLDANTEATNDSKASMMAVTKVGASKKIIIHPSSI